jgi:hypothetical protein
MVIRVLVTQGVTCLDFGIHYQASSAAHLQTNRQVERANRLILQEIKIRIF